MPHPAVVPLTSALVLALALPSPAYATEADDAQRLCEERIREVYGVSHLRDVWTEQVGNHKFRVQGQVKDDHQLYPFDCKIKYGQVQSYAYEGPHDRHGDHDGKLGTALAVGAGLAIVAAIAASRSGDGGQGEPSLQVAKTALDDDCHDALESRIRYERNGAAQVSLRNTELSGRDLSGEARVSYYDGRAKRASFTCHFDPQGRLLDSSYQLY